MNGKTEKEKKANKNINVDVRGMRNASATGKIVRPALYRVAQ